MNVIGPGELLDRYQAFLIDAYGVLVDAERALPGAHRLIDAIARAGKQYYVVSNDASRSPETSAARFRSLGLAIPPERIISSGTLLLPYFREHQLQGARCFAMGPPDALDYVTKAGGILATGDDAEIRVIVLGDEAMISLLESLDTALSIIVRTLDRGAPLELLVPNPDLIYPKSEGRFGIAAGSLAATLEVAMTARGHSRRFVRLGKPHAPIFEEALRRAACPKDQVVMIGDQLETDIRGANTAGLDSALVTFGVTRMPAGELPAEIRPTFFLDRL